MAYVYRHIRLDKNEPFYIGISNIDNNFSRAFDKSKRNSIWKNIVSKTKYKVEILFNDLSWEEACEKEKEFISLYGRKNIDSGILSNLTDGGEGVQGKVTSKETKHKLSLKAKGREISENTKKAVSISNKNRPISDSTRNILRKRMIGNKINLGRKFEEVKKPKTCISIGLKIVDEKNFICYYGTVSASEHLKYDSSNIRKMLKGKKKNKFGIYIVDKNGNRIS